jgi:hypothetical protein
MPSRKQRRRREKLKRHEWEEVYVDEEGRELDPEEAEQLVGPQERRAARSTKAERPQSRSGRPIEPPSWRKTLRRGALFFPLMLITVFLIAGEEASTGGKIAQTFVLMAFFLPFSYFMDSVVWRSYQRRIAKLGSGKER